MRLLNQDRRSLPNAHFLPLAIRRSAGGGNILQVTVKSLLLRGAISQYDYILPFTMVRAIWHMMVPEFILGLLSTLDW